MSPVAVGLLVRALVLLTVAWLAVTMLRRRSASLRALVWTTALAGVLVLPVMASVAPSLDVPVWRAEPAMVIAASQVPPSPSATTVTNVVQAPDALADSLRASTSAPAAVTSFESGEPFSWGPVALLAWGLVSLVLAARIGLSHFSLSRLARSGVEAPDARDAAWAPLVDEARAHLGIRRIVRVRTTDAIGVPAVAGLFTPVLLLPAEAGDWHDDVKRSVVLHELAHVARWDAVGQLVSQLACAVYWCVPLAWHAASRAAILREQASDDVVLMSGVRASAYAANLLNVAQLTGNAALEPAALAMAHPRRIRERIVAILDPASAREALRLPSRATVAITAATIVALVATVQPTTQAAALPPTADRIATTAPTADAAVTAVAGPTVVRASRPSVRLEARDEPAAQAPSVGPCDKEMDSNSSSSHDDGKTKWWTVKMSGRNCKVEMRVDGTVEFNDTFTDVKGLSRGGSFKLDVTEGGVRRELEIQERAGALTRLYRVDSRERPFDNDGRAWFGQFLITLDRRTAVGVDVRLPQLLKQGGVDAVLKETALMPSDYPRSRYYEKLMAARQLNDDERARVLKQAAAMTKSDHYASVLLAEVARGGFQNNEVRAAALSMIDRMESDHYRSTAVANVMGAGRPTAADMDVLVRTVERIESDHYKLEVLRRTLAGPLQPQHRAALARAARTVEGDHYASEFLKALVGNGDAVERQVFLEVIDTIEGDHYRNESIQALLRTSGVTESDLLKVVAVTAPMSGDHYKAESLQAVARHRAATDRVRTAVLDASERMSSHYREQVRRAAGKN